MNVTLIWLLRGVTFISDWSLVPWSSWLDLRVWAFMLNWLHRGAFIINDFLWNPRFSLLSKTSLKYTIPLGHLPFGTLLVGISTFWHFLIWTFVSGVVYHTHISQKRQEYGIDAMVAGSTFTSTVQSRPQIQIHSY